MAEKLIKGYNLETLDILKKYILYNYDTNFVLRYILKD